MIVMPEEADPSGFACTTRAVEQDRVSAFVDEIGIEVTVPTTGEIEIHGDGLDLGDAEAAMCAGVGEAASSLSGMTVETFQVGPVQVVEA